MTIVTLMSFQIFFQKLLCSKIVLWCSKTYVINVTQKEVQTISEVV